MDDSRPITNAEIQFFSRSGTGKGMNREQDKSGVLTFI